MQYKTIFVSVMMIADDDFVGKENKIFGSHHFFDCVYIRRAYGMFQWTVAYFTCQKDNILLNNNEIILYIICIERLPYLVRIIKNLTCFCLNINAFKIMLQSFKLPPCHLLVHFTHQDSSRESEGERLKIFCCFKCLLKCAFPHNLFSI